MLILKLRLGDSIAFFDGIHNGSIAFVSIETSDSERKLLMSIRYKQMKTYHHLKRFSTVCFFTENDSYLNIYLKRLTPSLIVLGITTLGDIKCFRVKGNKDTKMNKQTIPA